MNTQDQGRPTNKGLQVAGEHGAATTEARYGKEFLLAKIAEKHRAIFPSVKELQAESEAWLDEELDANSTPKPPTMRDILGPGGIIAQNLPGYETREPQLQMAEMVDEAIREKAHLIAEAGTGTGKSLAYLIPAIYSRKQTVVSTGDKSLQEQLWRKDIPFLRSVLPIEFEAAILKGRANYLCIENWNNEAGEQMMLGESMEFTKVRKWLETTESGDLEELPFTVGELAAKITSTSDACTGQHCPQFKGCYAEKAKEKAKMAQVVIVNHSLLTIDAALRARSDDFASAIPNRDIVIIDEAHRLEDAATAAFTIEVSAGGVNRLVNDKHVNALQETLSKQPDTVPQANRLNQLRSDIETTVTLFFGALSEMSNSQSYAVTAPPVSLQNHAQNLALQLGDLERLLESRNPYDVDHDNPAKSEAYKKFVGRVENYADAVRGSLLKNDSEVIYVEKRENRKGKQLIYLKKAPICVAGDLREALFEKWPTICTSATIATEGNADYFKSRVGCDSAKELIVDSPFDYRSNALIYLPRNGNVLDPTRYYGQDNSPLYFDNLANEIEQLLLISDGRAFCLFTSRKALEEIYSCLHSRLRKWEVLRQGDYPRPELVKRFKEDGHAILFGLKSFWEGVDIQGEALSLVVIDKIPFGQPDDPIYSARCDEIGKRTGDKWAWFNKLALPNAIITYKQGFGRLVRTKADWGCVALLDGRITTKGYGTKVLRSLPKASRTDSVEAVKTFFETRGQR